MADAYYYQANDQTLGPFTPSALKQLANEGVIDESTPIRKGEQGAWYQAGTISGLISPKPAKASVPPGVDSDSSERARQAFRKAEDAGRQGRRKIVVPRPEIRPVFHAEIDRRPWAIYLCLAVVLFLGR